MHRGDVAAVVAKVTRTGADASAVSFDVGEEPLALQMSHTVWCQEHAGADFAQRFGLLVDGDADFPRDQSVRGEQPSDSTAYDCDSQGLFQLVTFARWVRLNYEPK